MFRFHRSVVMVPNQLFALLPEMAIFARVVDAGNFSLAARQLGSTPSSVSRQIARLEEALGARLLERSTRKIRVTSTGQQVYRYCREMVGAASNAVDAASEAQGLGHEQPRGQVSLSAPTAFAKTVIHPLVAGFLRAYETIDLRLFYTDVSPDPLADDFDLVIRLTNQPPPGLAGRRLGSVRWVLGASPAYLAMHATPKVPADLAAHDCIYLGEQADDRRWRLSNGRQSHTVAVHGRYAANHAGARLDAAQQHLGIAALPEFVARSAFEDASLRQVLPEWELEAHAYIGAIWLLYPPNRFLPPKVRVLIDYLARHLGA